jgi:hypothetical protein
VVTTDNKLNTRGTRNWHVTTLAKAWKKNSDLGFVAKNYSFEHLKMFYPVTFDAHVWRKDLQRL